MSGRAVLRFAAFELRPDTGELRQGGDLRKLAPQPFKVLELLARRGGEVVTRGEIRDHVWSGDTFVDFDQGLNFCIRQIREVLGDTADAPQFIETLPRRGYRFLMPHQQALVAFERLGGSNIFAGASSLRNAVEAFPADRAVT